MMAKQVIEKKLRVVTCCLYCPNGRATMSGKSYHCSELKREIGDYGKVINNIDPDCPLEDAKE